MPTKNENHDSVVICLAGKGGVGKTSIAALLLDELARNGYPGPTLAVDADPASTLYIALGLPAPITTVGHVRDHTSLNAQTVRSLPPEVTKADYVAAKLAEAQVLTRHELRGMPLHYMAMGQSEGPGCYCAVNATLSQVLAELMRNYPLVVVDSEAGLEHLSRVRLKRVDFLWVVANQSRASMHVADQILATAQDVDMEIGQSGIILNRAQSFGGCQPIRDDTICVIPEEPMMASLEATEQPVVSLPRDTLVRTRLSALLQPILMRSVPYA